MVFALPLEESLAMLRWVAIVLAGVVLAGCPAPRQRDKDAQTGMAPAHDTTLQAVRAR
jgi:hypothetical protein